MRKSKAVSTTTTSSDVDVVASPILAKPVAEMTLQERSQGYAILNYLKKAIEERMSKIKPILLEDAKTNGELQDTGSHHLFVEGTKVRRQRSQAKEPGQTKMFDLLAKKKIETHKVYDEVPTYVYNPSKVEMLIATGHLKRDEVENLKEVSYSLYVDPSPELQQMLVEAGKAYGADSKKLKG